MAHQPIPMDGQSGFDVNMRQRAQTAGMPVEQMTAPMENDWIELNDYHNMVDEQMIEPDYFIDRANPAVFIPDDAGIDKATCLDDRNDPDLYDFEQEVEPILQVLVGKTLEHARIEIIEDYENE